ncbi:MAG TPA: hypothetical protein VIL86_04595, partial [Tepidisphaeraceae bacterium]
MIVDTPIPATEHRLPRQQHSRANPSPLSSRWPLILWLLSGILLFVQLGYAPVPRTQEIRVLESAREMVGGVGGVGGGG